MSFRVKIAAREAAFTARCCAPAAHKTFDASSAARDVAAQYSAATVCAAKRERAIYARMLR